MEVESRIGRTIARLRQHAGLSQPQLAALAAVPVSTVVGVELGTIEPPATLVARLAAAVAGRLRGEHERCPGAHRLVPTGTGTRAGATKEESTCSSNRAGRGRRSGPRPRE